MIDKKIKLDKNLPAVGSALDFTMVQFEVDESLLPLVNGEPKVTLGSERATEEYNVGVTFLPTYNNHTDDKGGKSQIFVLMGVRVRLWDYTAERFLPPEFFKLIKGDAGAYYLLEYNLPKKQSGIFTPHQSETTPLNRVLSEVGQCGPTPYDLEFVPGLFFFLMC